MPKKSKSSDSGEMDYLSGEDELLSFERLKYREGFCFIAGIDEAGRGPLAGPVVAAAVMFPQGAKIPKVFDSKQLSAERREELFEAVRAVPGVKIGVAEIGPEVIDEINILRATHLAMRQAAEQIPEADFLLVDGLPVPGLPKKSENIVKGDAKSASIAAASIIAKVTRDRVMLELDKKYPQYGFAEHKGYGTAAHLAALRKYGAAPVHRRSFAPVRDILVPPPEQPDLFG